MQLIPRIIHQTWKTNDIPPVMKNYVKSWRSLHPHYEYKLWTDTDIRNLIKDYYPWFLKYFDGYPHHIMRVDAFRFFVLYKYGGVYVDLDLEAYKCIDPLLNNEKTVLFLETNNSISNAIMCSVRNNPFLEHVFDELIKVHSTVGTNTDAWKMTGPAFLTNIINSLKSQIDIKIYPSEYYFPIPWHSPLGDQSGQSLKFSHSYGAHHWQGTWWQPQWSSFKLVWILFIMIIVTILFLTWYIIIYKGFY